MTENDVKKKVREIIVFACGITATCVIGIFWAIDTFLIKNQAEEKQEKQSACDYQLPNNYNLIMYSDNTIGVVWIREPHLDNLHLSPTYAPGGSVFLLPYQSRDRKKYSDTCEAKYWARHAIEQDENIKTFEVIK